MSTQEVLRSNIEKTNNSIEKKKYYEVLLKHPDCTLEDYLNFAIFLRDTNIPESLEILDGAQNRFGENAWIDDNRARAYKLSNKLSQAISSWEKAFSIANDKNKNLFFDELSKAYDISNKFIIEQTSDAKKKLEWDKVISVLNSHKRYQKYNLNLYFEICIAYRNLKDYTNALETLKTAEIVGLRSPWISDNYARIFFDMQCYKKSIRYCLLALQEACNDYERAVFVGFLEGLNKKIENEHRNGKNLNILPVDVDFLSMQVIEERKNPEKIALDIYDEISEDQCDAAFQIIKNGNDFFNVDQEIKILVAYYLPQFKVFLEEDNELSMNQINRAKVSSSFRAGSLLVEENSKFLNDYSAASRSRLIEIILLSGLFNTVLYRQQADLILGLSESIEHFLLNGNMQKFYPMSNFDSEYYREINTDIPWLSDVECFVHYVLIGRLEKRYYNRAMLMRDTAILRLQAYFDSAWYVFCAKEILENNDPYSHYLAIGWRKKLSPNRHLSFDSNIYLKYYLDARESITPPFLHYCMQGANRCKNLEDIEQNVVNPIIKSGEFDTMYYQIQCNKENITVDDSIVLHYIYKGTELNFSPNESFNAEYYIKRYPDLNKNGQNPFIHYINHGKNEMRIAIFNSHKYIQSGHSEFDPSKPTILVVCHEASRTGAPILGLQLIQHLSYRCNVVSWIVKGGVLFNNFVESSVAIVNNPNHHVDAIWTIRELQKRYLLQVAVLNSVVTSDISVALYEEKIPTLALIHEYSEYMSSNVTQILFAANRIVFPAQGVKESAELNSIKSFGVLRANTTVRHQGHCTLPDGNDGKTYTRNDILLQVGISEDDEIPAIVLGCGWVHMRKGVEYFIEAARYCKDIIDKPIRFIWVGGGYSPDTDLHYSAWLKSQIINSGLEEDVIFFEETNDLSPFFELAHVFFLSSRLDPFPNVAIDAVSFGVPIVVFERGTGFADFINNHPLVGVTVPFLDAKAASNVICDYITGKRSKPSNSEEILNSLSFSSYADFIWSESLIAIEQQKQIDEETKKILLSKQLNTEFYTSATPNWQSAMSPEYIYVAMWARGIGTAKSRVGFNDRIAQALWSAEMAKSRTITPLAHLLDTKKAPFTHKTIYINTSDTLESYEGKLSVALHIHAYYVEELPVLLKRFSVLGKKINLFITTDTENKAKLIRVMTKKIFLTETKVLVTPNRGRDVAPFIMVMKQYLSDFGIIGHFHIKGTKQLEQTVVQQWQSFLYGTLIGQHGEIADYLLHKLEKNPRLGLLFQEDPCLPSWGKNRELADNLLKDIGINRQTQDNLEYPTGNMFWARSTALLPLMKRDWQWRDFPAEPVPYDGSILHAIERLTPIICEEAGYEWATVHNSNVYRYNK